MQIRPSSIQVRFLTQINGIGKNVAGTVRDFHNLDLRNDFGDWAGQLGVKLDGGDYCFEIGASNLLNNSITFVFYLFKSVPPLPQA